MTDSLTMIRRNLLHLRRYPTLPIALVGTPLVFLLLFVYVFGGTLGDGLGGLGGSGGRAEYLRYVTPGILLMTVAGAAQVTAISVAMDMTERIVTRFKTMAIRRSAVLTGHVAGSTLQTMVATAAIAGFAVLLGFRPQAGPLEWLAAFGLLLLVTLAVVWLAVALGMFAKGVESASNLPMPLMLLPFLGSGFVPAETLPVGLRWFAEYQPFTPIIETLRGLLLGTPIGSSGAQAVAWCAATALGSYLWALRLYERERPA
jgi:ABC-2 type transport system permease protein